LRVPPPARSADGPCSAHDTSVPARTLTSAVWSRRPSASSRPLCSRAGSLPVAARAGPERRNGSVTSARSRSRSHDCRSPPTAARRSCTCRRTRRPLRDRLRQDGIAGIDRQRPSIERGRKPGLHHDRPRKADGDHRRRLPAPRDVRRLGDHAHLHRRRRGRPPVRALPGRRSPRRANHGRSLHRSPAALRLVKSTGGNTGAAEIQVFSQP
jgi:hypothetical protein